MSRNLTLPFFPLPPSQYDKQYFAEVYDLTRYT
jgi:hypothetical protein